MGVSPYGFPAMSMKCVPGCASSPMIVLPGPSTAELDDQELGFLEALNKVIVDCFFG
jgi:hypothetical protein